MSKVGGGGAPAGIVLCCCHVPPTNAARVINCRSKAGPLPAPLVCARAHGRLPGAGAGAVAGAWRGGQDSVRQTHTRCAGQMATTGRSWQREPSATVGTGAR